MCWLLQGTNAIFWKHRAAKQLETQNNELQKPGAQPKAPKNQFTMNIAGVQLLNWQTTKTHKLTQMQPTHVTAQTFWK